MAASNVVAFLTWGTGVFKRYRPALAVVAMTLLLAAYGMRWAVRPPDS